MSAQPGPIPLTQGPNEEVLGPQGEHGEVEVDDLLVEGCGGDEAVVYGALHWDQLVDGQVHAQRDDTREQLGDHVILRGEKKSIQRSDLNMDLRSYNSIKFHSIPFINPRTSKRTVNALDWIVRNSSNETSIQVCIDQQQTR